MKKKCKPRCGPPPKCKKPSSWNKEVDLMAGFMSLGIVCLCAYTMTVVMVLVNSV